MKETKTQERYTSPEVKVVEIKARQMLCQSTTGNTPNMTNDDNPYGF